VNRGRQRTTVTAASAEADTSVTSTPNAEEGEEATTSSAPSRSRGRGRGRGRGKGRTRRTRRATSTIKEKVVQDIPSETLIPVEGSEIPANIATPSDMAVDRDIPKGLPDADKIDGVDSDAIVIDEDD